MADLFTITVDLGPLDELRRGWSAASQKALQRAVKGTAYYLQQVSREALMRGVGPSPAPLTRREQRTQSGAALSTFHRFVAYAVEGKGSDLQAKIGLGRSVARARNPGGRRRQVVALLQGGEHPITREDQARIAAKLRKRLERGLSTQFQGYGLKGRRRHAAGLARRAPLAKVLPKVGSVLSWPARDYVADIVRREGPNARRVVAKLYGMALKGERWAGVFWREAEVSLPSPSHAAMTSWVESLLTGGL